jgi:lipoprotein signal peptidase
VADMYVTCAAIVLFLLVVFEKKENEITEEKEEV